MLQYGVDIFMTSEAVLSGYSVAQVTLGSKIHKPSAPKLGKMFTQVVDTLFRQLSVSSWERHMQRPLSRDLEFLHVFHRCYSLQILYRFHQFAKIDFQLFDLF